MAEKWLVIDDSATIQRVIKLAFQDYDVLISEADSIQDALRELARNPSTLVIADAALSGVQSVQDFVRLKEAAATPAFIVLEGSYDHIDENQFRSAGFRYFLKKPFDANQLISITREALGRAIPSRFDPTEVMPPPTPKPFHSAEEELKAPPPPPHSSVPRSLHDELENPFGNTEGFDLGLDEGETGAGAGTKADQEFRDSAFSIAKAPLPSLEADEAHRAKPYFPEAEDEAEPIPQKRVESFPLESSYGRRLEPSYNPQALNGMLEPMLRDEMEKIVRQSVEEYCRKHFAELAREYLIREIEKLSAERSRLLVGK